MGELKAEHVLVLLVAVSLVSLAIGYEVGFDDAGGLPDGLPFPVSNHPGIDIDDPLTPSQKIVDEIDYILGHTNSTHYEHHPALGANISRAEGIYDTDCSGYVDYVLNLTVPTWYDAITYYGDGERPLAEDLYGFFAQAQPERGWTRVRKMADAEPGDLLAYKHPIHDPNTGHVVFIHSHPEPSMVNDGEYWVWVSDSTASHHGEDPRETTGNGVGRGKMWFGVDHDGRPIYFRWSSVDGERLYYPISIARATEEGASIPGADRIANRAEYIVHMERLTAYWHHTIIQESEYVYITDCSGLVDYILKTEEPGLYSMIEFDESAESRPLAHDYYETFANAGATAQAGEWSRVARLQDARSGDILAYKHAEATDGSTGHVMVVDSTPQASTENDNEYWVWVIDSALSGHGDDTRDTDEDNVRFKEGVGRGKVWFGVDSSGAPTYYRWSSSDGNEHHEQIAIGHPN
jgi:hypothetical protein